MRDLVNKKALQVGITGGIGSGKTTVCKIFSELGIPVYNADDRAKILMVQNPIIRGKIIKLFGAKAYLPDGNIDRVFIAGIVFNDPKKLKALNKIVHPEVGKDGVNWHFSQQNVPYTLKEAALMIESGNYKHLDKLIVVTAPKEVRLQRVMKRDNANMESVLARMDKQMAEEEKIQFADFVIYNDGSTSLIKQVWAIHQKLIAENIRII